MGTQTKATTPGPLAQIRKGETRVYFAVPTDYTIGETFSTYKEAEAFARSQIKTLKYGEGIPDGKSRQFVDVRVADESGDAIVHRVEIYVSSTTTKGPPCPSPSPK